MSFLACRIPRSRVPILLREPTQHLWRHDTCAPPGRCLGPAGRLQIYHRAASHRPGAMQRCCLPQPPVGFGPGPRHAPPVCEFYHAVRLAASASYGQGIAPAPDSVNRTRVHPCEDHDSCEYSRTGRPAPGRTRMHPLCYTVRRPSWCGGGAATTSGRGSQ